MRLRGECKHGYYSDHSTSFRLGEGSWCEGSHVFDGEWVDWCDTHGAVISPGVPCDYATGIDHGYGECVPGRRIIAKETSEHTTAAGPDT